MREKIIGFIEKNFLFGESFGIGDDDSFFDAQVIDSTGVLDLICWLEDNFSIKITDEDILPENFDSINNIIRYIERKTNV